MNAAGMTRTLVASAEGILAFHDPAIGAHGVTLAAAPAP